MHTILSVQRVASSPYIAPYTPGKALAARGFGTLQEELETAEADTHKETKMRKKPKTSIPSVPLLAKLLSNPNTLHRFLHILFASLRTWILHKLYVHVKGTDMETILSWLDRSEP
jgi:hypothetical protein